MKSSCPEQIRMRVHAFLEVVHCICDFGTECHFFIQHLQCMDLLVAVVKDSPSQKDKNCRQNSNRGKEFLFS